MNLLNTFGCGTSTLTHTLLRRRLLNTHANITERASLAHTEVYCTQAHSQKKGCVVLSFNSTVFLSLAGPVTHSSLSTSARTHLHVIELQ